VREAFLVNVTAVQIRTRAFLETYNWRASCASHPYRGRFLPAVPRGGSLSLAHPWLPSLHASGVRKAQPEGLAG
jgi:hypothetical protein